MQFDSERGVEITNAEYLRNLAEKLRNIPATYGTDGGDVDACLAIAKSLDADSQWEHVNTGDKDWLDRMAVPGGWIYRSTTEYMTHKKKLVLATESMVFVPA